MISDVLSDAHADIQEYLSAGMYRDVEQPIRNLLSIMNAVRMALDSTTPKPRVWEAIAALDVDSVIEASVQP